MYSDKEHEQMKNKKPLFIALLVVDVIVTLGLAVFNIIMFANVVGKTAAELAAQEGYFGYLAQNTTLYLLCYVVPLFVLLAANVIGLVIYVRKAAKKEPVKVDDLTDEQREALKQELLRDLNDK